MSDNPHAYVAAIGMVTPIGADAVMTYHSINTEISRVQESTLLGRKYEPIGLSLVPEDVLSELHPKLGTANLPDRQCRMLRLAGAALAQLSGRLPSTPVPLYLAVPEQLPGRSVPLVGNFIEQLVLQTELPLDTAASLIAPIGRAGGLHAVRKAHQYLSQPGHDYVLIGGVDTYWDPYLLAKLEADDRLHGRGNMDGFIPGEGAAFVLLASDRVKARLPAPHVALAMPGCAEESGHRYSDEPYLGDGMAQAVQKAFGFANPQLVQSVWTSMIYDSYGHKEIGVALTRSAAKIVPEVEMRHPVDCLGDMGAAAGCALIGLIAAAVPWRTRYRNHLICCASDLSHRAALRVDVV